MTHLTKEYIADHLQTVHTYDSIGRSITEKILNHASEQVEQNDKGITVARGELGFAVRAAKGGCITITFSIKNDDGSWSFGGSYHVDTGKKDDKK